jgi:hypothetical protein
MSLVFDTLKLSKALGRAFTPEQAEVLTEALTVNVSDGLATKADLSVLQAEVKAEIAALDAKLSGDIAALDTRLTGSIAALDTKLTTKLSAVETAVANSRAELVRWIVTSLAANTVAMIAIAFTVAKIVAPK